MWIVDKDVVQLSNLNRQIVHWERDISRRKVESRSEKLQQINSDIKEEQDPSMEWPNHQT